ncbi:MAG: chorismate mutase [Burkholderiales bacterium]
MKSPKACRNLTDIRAAVNTIDRDLVKLLARRQKYALAALPFKHDRKSIGDPRHRKAMFVQRKAWAKPGKLNPRMVQKIFQAIVDESKRLHLAGFRMKRG